jgi:uncharacterized protein YebE (UPF0316 family)
MLILPLIIGVAETGVVTLDTVRTIFIARGMKVYAALLALLEVTIWLFAISQIMQNLSDVGCFIGYGVGFTLGTYLGICIEERLALGKQAVRLITRKDVADLITALRGAGHGVTLAEAEGATGGVNVLFTIVERRQLAGVVEIIEKHDPSCLYVVEDVRMAARGTFPFRGLRDGHRVKNVGQAQDAAA